jgi:cell division protein FtsB
VGRAERRQGRSERRPPKRGTPTRADRRAEQARRRGYFLLAGAVGATAVVLVAWFPAGALLAQRRTLAQATTTLHDLTVQDRALRAESRNLANPAEIARIARQQFGLVAPGQIAYQVLPPPGRGSGVDDTGDPGLSPLVSPSAAPELPPGTVATSGVTPAKRTASHSTASAAGSPGLFTRVLDTLEFWR